MNDVVTFLIYIIYFISRNQLERLDKSGLGVDIPCLLYTSDAADE